MSARNTAFNLEGSGFDTRAELTAWFALCEWLDAPDPEPDAFLWLGDAVGWVPGAQVEVRSRARSTVAPQPSGAAPRFLTLQEASALTRTPAETIRYWVWQGRLVAYKPGRTVLVREDELLGLIESRETRRIRAAKGTAKTRVVGA